MKVILLFVAFLFIAGYYAVRPRIIVHVGDMAPEFSLIDSDGSARSLSDFRGRSVVLYFFPKGGTPGCTKQACSLRDKYASFKEKNIEIIGISYDSVEQLASFKKDNHLPFVLMSDNKKEVASLYGANRVFYANFFPHRITFIINGEGKIIEIMPHISVDTHTEKVIKIFENMS